MATIFDSEQTKREAISLAKGHYQYGLLAGVKAWSGSDLAGTAKRHSGSYKSSRDSLFATLNGRFECHFETVERRKVLVVKARRHLDLTVRDEATAAIVRELGLYETAGRATLVLKAEHVDDCADAAILKCTVYGSEIEGHGPGLDIFDDVYLVARRDRRRKWMIRDTLRKAKATARSMRDWVQAEDEEAARVHAVKVEANRRLLEAEMARRTDEEDRRRALTDEDEDEIIDALG